MIKINLLPKEIEKKAVKKEFGVLIGIGVGLVVAILLGLYLLRLTQYTNLNKKMKLINEELITLKKITDQVDQLQAQKNRLNQKLGVINNIIKGRLIYPYLMEDLAGIISSSMWLTSLNIRGESNVSNLNMRVVAFDNYTIASFITALENSEKFNSIELGSISTMVLEEKTYRQFSVTCNYVEK